MTLVELLSSLRARDINLWAEGERLCYSAPSGALTPDIREELAKHKADLLTFLNETDRMRRVTRAPISRVSREAKLLPSVNQKRLWFIDQLEPNTAFNCYRADWIEGSLNIEALERSLNEIVRRHEILRTTFSTIDGEPHQVIAPVLKLRLTLIDLRDIVDATERETEAERIIAEEVERPFDLGKGPLIRAYLLCLGPEEHLLLLTMHHIVTDAWSMGILVKELTVLYEAFSNRRPSPLPELPIQYVDFAHWQSQRFQEEVLQQELAYWKERLKGAPEVTELPTDYVRPAVQNFQGASESVVIPKSLTEALKTLSRSQGVTLFMTVLAAFKTLLYRYTGQEDLVFGSPIAGRIRSDIENLIGLFINTLVLRTDLSGDPSFRELLGRVRGGALEAYAHQEVPFEKLVEDLRLERSFSFTPLFQVMFVLQNTPQAELKLSGSTVTPVTIKRETSLFDLFLSLGEGEQGLEGTLSYKTDLFDRTTISRMIGRFQILLRAIVADPDQAISTLPLLNETEKHQLSVEWNDTAKIFPNDACIHKLFEAQVERTPDANAVSFRDQQLTYGELNRRANQVAHYLQRLGVGPETLVGICMERSLDMLVGLLGVLKAGGAYVSLDPNHPAERLAFMLQDTNAPVLLTHQRSSESGRDSHPRLPILDSQLKVICLDAEREIIARESEENPCSDLSMDNLAYVIYTSGSTGKPKGVTITHRALHNFAVSARASFALFPGDRVLQFASISFDAAAEEIYPTLISGAGLVLRTDSMLASVASFLEHCAEWRVTVLDLPTAYWHELTDKMIAENLPAPECLRLVIIGGERANSERFAQWRNAVGDRVRLLNTYGPTETTVVATTWESVGSAELDCTAREIPIGRPIANAQIYILDAYLQPMPAGARGDLYIGGTGLARGYLNRPDFAAASFIPNPFSDTGARLYKTGDLARYLPDGNIEFLGRKDNQIKIRGFRIELEEIEAVLAHHPSVREAAVVAREEASGDKRLVAYVVPGEQAALGTDDVRGFVKEKLPDYMVPSAFVLLNALPLTPNGKVDRKALPAPDQHRPAVGAFGAPRSPVEEILGEIWADVLKLDQVGLRDNFFELGGHSLLATQVMSRVQKAFQVELPLRSLFESPTLGEFAERIDALRREGHGIAQPPIVPVAREKELPLSFAQERLWFLDQLEPNSSVYNMSGAYRVSGGLDIGALERSMNEIVRRHEALRTTFRSVDGAPRQVIAAELMLPLPVIDLSEHSSSAREGEARQYAAEFVRRPFDLSQGPLMRAALVCLGEQEHILLLSMHHIVSDGWSMAIFFRELSLLYEAYANGQASPLAELPVQYVDYAVWQRNWLQGEVLESQLAYWKKQLANISPLKLATDRPRPFVQTFHGKRESLNLPQDLTQALKQIGRKQGASLFMILLAALQILLHRLTAQEDIVVGSPIAGRNRTEAEGLIGFFLNSLVLRANLSGDPTFSQLLDQVRSVCLEAYAHQDVPFEKLLEELRPERDLSRTPFFQVFLNMVNLGDRVRPAGLKLEPISHAAEAESKFDLTIYARERAGSLHLNWVYNADLFDRERIRELLSQYETLLAAIAEQPAAGIHAYSLVTAAAEEVLPNPTEPLACDWKGAVHDKMSQHSESFPDRIAISDPSGEWTYAELDARSNELANYLLENSVQREDIIAIYGHRSAALPWALLGVFKAGAAFLILDPAYPPARLIQYVRGAKPRGFISLNAAGAISTDLEQALEETIRCRIALPKLSRSKAEGPFENYSSEDPKIKILPEDLAYISYTSGSTGEPKGVQGRHGPLSHFLPWQAAHFGLTPADRFSLLSGLSHDPLHREILTALWVGGTLCIPEPDAIGASGDLGEWMARQRITFAHLTPALGRVLADGARPDCQITSLRYAFFIGEKLTRRDLSCLRRLAPQVTNVNYYGSTETQRAVSYHTLAPNAEVETGGNIVPVGRGMPGAQLLLLTRTQNLAGIGEVGEIYIRSPHLARGYLGDPSHTKARFIANPFTGLPNDRMYRTGDFGRYLSDGTVDVLGRMDGQINIRGFRVETGEIEFALSQCPGVRDVVVVAREEEDGDNRLIAYIVAGDGSAASSQELRSFLKQRLPDHMIPSAFVSLEFLPLTPNGKVDRNALPAPEDTRQDRNVAPTAPRDRLELQLREIWRKVLRRPLGVRDNFFDLGGHSLLAVRLFAQIEKVTGMRLSVAVLFQAPTVEKLAQLMGEQGAPRQWKSLVAIQPGGSRPPFFCVHAHDGGVLFWRDLARYLGPDQPFYALQPRGLDGLEPLHSTIEEMASHYVREIRTLQPEGPYYIGGHCIGGLIAFEMAQQLRVQGETVAFLAVIDSFAPRPERPAKGSLWRRYRYRAIRFFERTIGLHLGNLSVLKAGERLPYMKGKIDKALYKVYMGLGARWVAAARNRQNILKAGRQASRQYRPQVYPGKITLFRATDLGGRIEHDPKMGWGRWAGGELETHIIPGYHAHIVLEPRVRLLATELSLALAEVQQTDRRIINDRIALPEATGTVAYPGRKFAVG